MTLSGRTVGQLCAEEHCGHAEEVDARCYETDSGYAQVGGCLDELGKDEDVAVGAGEQQEPECAELPDERVDENPADWIRRVMDVIAGVFDASRKPVAFRFGEPGRVGWFVGKEKQEGDAEQQRRDAFDKEEPLPPGEVRAAIEVEQYAGDSTHEDPGERERDVEAADGAGTLFRRKPLHEVEDDSGEEACLRHAEEEACDVELHGCPDKEHANGYQAPGQHDAREPAAGAEAVQCEVGGYFADGIAEKEEAGAEAVDCAAEVQGLIHLEGGEADVGAIHVRAAIAECDERDQAKGGLAESTACDRA